MFGNFFSKAHVQGGSNSQMAATMPAELQASFSSLSTSFATHENPGVKMQQLLSEALDGLGIDLHSLPADWRQRVTIELLRQMRGSQASLQIDPATLKSLLTQFAQQSSHPTVSTSQAGFSVPTPHISKPVTMAKTSSLSPATPTVRRPHVDIFQL